MIIHQSKQNKLRPLGFIICLCFFILSTACHQFASTQEKLMSFKKAPEPPPQVSQPQTFEPPEAYLFRAVQYLDSGHYEEAKINLRRALTLNPELSRAQLYLDQMTTHPNTLCRNMLDTYEVQPNQRLSDIAKQCLGNTDLFPTLARCNGILVPSRLSAGEQIRVPKNSCQTIQSKFDDLFAKGKYTQLIDLAAQQPASSQAKAPLNGLIFKSHLALMRETFKDDEFSALKNMKAAELQAAKNADLIPSLNQAKAEAAQHYFKNAVAFKGQGKIKGTIEQLNIALAFSPNDSKIKQLLQSVSSTLKQEYLTKGNQALYQEDPQKAIEYLEKALSLDPKDSDLQRKIDDLMNLIR